MFVDRTYGSGRRDVQAQAVDFPHIRRLFDSLMNSLTALQVAESKNEASLNGKKRINKSLASNPFGFVNVEDVASVPLRLLRINSTSNPKQARADKRLYDELIQTHLNDLQCLAWKVLGFLFRNVEIGTEVFERELAVLVRDQIKSDLKESENIGKASECALNNFNDLLKTATSFNGQIFICEIISSGILVELSAKTLRRFASLLRSGPNLEKTTVAASKKARYHQQVNESDQKRLEAAQEAFCSDLDGIFYCLLSTFGVFESSQGHLNPQDHVSLSENLLLALTALLKSQHNYKFVHKIPEYLRLLTDALSFCLVSFQPAYLPPFLPLSMRLLSSLAGRNDSTGLSARRSLLQVELIIHPRRVGPVTYRPASEAILKIFERPEPVVEDEPVGVKNDDLKADDCNLTVKSNEVTIDEPVTETAIIKNEPVTKSVTIKTEPDAEPVIIKSEPMPDPKNSEPTTSTTNTLVPSKKRTLPSDDDDDEPLPQIIESGPDDN